MKKMKGSAKRYGGDKEVNPKTEGKGGAMRPMKKMPPKRRPRGAA